MKRPSEDYKRGARLAWARMRNGIETEPACLKAGGLLGSRMLDFFNGWNDQVEEPDNELHPPDFVAPPDHSGNRVLCIALGLSGLAGCALAALLKGWANPLLIAPAVLSVLMLVRARSYPA